MDQPSHDHLPDHAGLDPLDAFALVIEAPAGERSAAIDRICRDDAQLRREVEDLLRHHEDPVQGLREDAVGAIDGGGVAGMVEAFLAVPEAHGASEAVGEAGGAGHGPNPAPAAGAGAGRTVGRKAWVALCAVLVIAAAIWGAIRLAAWRQEANESAAAWSRALAAADPVDCRSFLMQVDPAHRDPEWRALLQRVDPVVHRWALVDANAGAAADEPAGREPQLVEAALAYLPDGVPCCAVGAGSTLRLVDVRTGATPRRFEANGLVRWPCFDPDRTRIAAWGHEPGAATATLWVWEVTTCALLCQAEVELASPVRLRFGPGGRILSWRSDRGVQQCSVATGSVRSVARRRIEPPSRVFGRGRSWHMDLDYGGNVVIVQRDLREHRELGKHRGTVRAAAFSPDGLRLATACDDAIRVWSLRDGLLETFARGARQLALADGGRQLLALTAGEAVLLAW